MALEQFRTSVIVVETGNAEKASEHPARCLDRALHRGPVWTDPDAPAQDPGLRWPKSRKLRMQVRSDFALKPDRQEKDFLDAETGRQKSPLKRRTLTETKIRELSGPKSPQEPPYLASTRNVRSGPNCMLPPQSSNQSPELEPGTEFFAAETGRRNGLIRLDCGSRDRVNKRTWQTCL
jgi:hypothetical protein